MDKEAVKDAFDHFAKNEFDVCKDVLNKAFDIKINDYLKTNLDLEKDPIVIEPTPEE